MKDVLRQDYDLIVCDGRPDSDVATLDIAKASDLIVIPCGVTLDDLTPQVRFAHELRSKGVKISKMLFAINKSVDSEVAVSDAKQFLTTAGYAVAETDIPMRTGYQIAQNSGRAISETLYPSLNQRAERLAQEIVARVTEEGEQ
jgi:chromosome partitioning protein